MRQVMSALTQNFLKIFEIKCIKIWEGKFGSNHIDRDTVFLRAFKAQELYVRSMKIDKIYVRGQYGSHYVSYLCF